MFSLIKNEEVTLLTDEPVIAAADIAKLESLTEVGNQLSEALGKVQSRIAVEEKAGFEKGFEKGRSQGLENAGAEVSQHLIKLSQQASAHELELQNSVVQLALQVVRKIAENVGAAETVAAMAETAARELLTGDTLAILVHPSVLDSVQQRLHSTQHDFSDSVCRIEIRSDDSLKPFDCLLETEFGTTVASLDEQLACLEKVLQQASASKLKDKV